MKKNGFSLIELLVVIGIIGLLLTVVLPAGTSLINKSNIKSCKKMVDIILTNAELCVIDKKEECNNEDDSFYITLKNLYDMGYLEKKYENKINNSYSIDTENNSYKIKVTKNTNDTTNKYYYNYKLIDNNDNDYIEKYCK